MDAFLLDPALKGVEKLVLSDGFPFRAGSKSIGNIKNWIFTPNAQWVILLNNNFLPIHNPFVGAYVHKVNAGGLSIELNLLAQMLVDFQLLLGN